MFSFQSVLYPVTVRSYRSKVFKFPDFSKLNLSTSWSAPPLPPLWRLLTFMYLTFSNVQFHMPMFFPLNAIDDYSKSSQYYLHMRSNWSVLLKLGPFPRIFYTLRPISLYLVILSITPPYITYIVLYTYYCLFVIFVPDVCISVCN